jgi:1-acyl-sn-glycerol-3-phosphate acyltransferase/nucleoside-diphosphate-sugar epimerase
MAVVTEVIKTTSSSGRQSRRVLVIDQRQSLAEALVRRLTAPSRERHGQSAFLAQVAASGDDVWNPTEQIPGHDVVVFSPLRPHRGRLVPDRHFSKSVLSLCQAGGVSHVVLVSSAEIYGSDYSHPGMVRERDTVVLKRANRLAADWVEIESLANTLLGNTACRSTIVRPCFVLSGDPREFGSRLFQSRYAFPLAGYDPNIQLLATDDLAEAIGTIVDAGKTGVYHVAPRDSIPLRKLLRLAGCRIIPIPYSFQRVARAIGSRIARAAPTDQIEYLRYPWTVSVDKLKRDLQFQPQHDSAEVILALQASQHNRRRQSVVSPGHLSRQLLSNAPRSARSFDDFGMDDDYIRSCGRWQLGFMERYYWRVEVKGLENIPKAGGGVLAGIHRGFMPFDGVMLVHLLSKYVGRVPRFLMHPGLVKFPHISRFLTRLGGVIACRENSDHVLRRGEILGVFPEGIRGAFRMYNRDIYQIGRHRDDYIRSALQHGVPILPFITIGPAETFPILAKVESAWWRRHTHWPFLPITPTANLIPLPTKWHIQILDPVLTTEYGPDATSDRRIIRFLSRRIRLEMKAAIDRLLQRRRSIFFGSLFEHLPEGLGFVPESTTRGGETSLVTPQR